MLFSVSMASAAVTPVPNTDGGAQAFAESISAPGFALGPARFETRPDGPTTGVSNSPVGKLPSSGNTFGVLSNGDATVATTPFSGTSSSFGGEQTHGARDVTVVAIPFNVPAGNQCLSFDFATYTTDGGYREGLIAEVDTNDWASTGPGGAPVSGSHNFATNSEGQPITSVDGNFTYELADGTPYSSGSLQYTARTPVTSGSHVLYLSIFDASDDSTDTASFVDNLKTSADPCVRGATTAKTLSATQSVETARIGTAHTTTATLREADGSAIANAPVKFTVTGANPTVRTIYTDASGVARLTQTGNNAGQDTTRASYDVDGDGVNEATSTGLLFVYTQPTVSVEDATVTEGNTGSTTASFTLKLSEASTLPATVDYVTNNGTASSNDFVASSGTVTFSPGQTSRTVNVSVNGDTLVEDDETVRLVLANPTGAKTQDLAVLTIVNDDMPTFSVEQSAVSFTEGTGAATRHNIVVNSDHVSDKPLTVAYETEEGTAVAPGDYAAAHGTVTIPAGETSGSAVVSIVGDDQVEEDEQFDVLFSNPSVGNVDTYRTRITIVNDDQRAPAAVSVDDARVTEGNSGSTNAAITVTTSQVSSAPTTVQYATVDGTAVAPSDYVSTNGTLTIPAGQTSATINVPVVGDRRVEGDQAFTVALSQPNGATLVKDRATVTITDDDTATVSLTGSRVTEGNTGYVDTTITATTDLISDRPITVNYATDNGTAVAPSDYLQSSGVITIPAGQTTATASVRVFGDSVVEPDEDFFANITGVSGAILGNARATVTIVNDDTAAVAPSLSAADVDVIEGDESDKQDAVAQIPVTLSKPATKAVTVKYRTVNGTAVAGKDYDAKNGTLTIAAGQTTANVSVVIDPDNKEESEETFTVVLDTPVNATVARGTSTVTILDDDESNGPRLCLFAEKFAIKIPLRSSPIVQATATVNGQRADVTKGKDGRYTAAVDLRGKNVGFLTVIIVETKDDKGRINREVQILFVCKK